MEPAAKAAIQLNLQRIVQGLTVLRIHLDSAPSRERTRERSNQISRVKRTVSICAGRIKEFRHWSRLAIVGGWRPSGQRWNRIEIDRGLIELVVRDVADIGNVDHVSFSEILLDTKTPVVRRRRFVAERPADRCL